MNYEKLSDFEINKAVAKLLGVEVQEWNGKIFGGVERNVDNVTSVAGVIDYCNNPSDAMPILIDNRISLTWVNGECRASSVLRGYHEFSCGNAMLAAMIVYLMMKDSG